MKRERLLVLGQTYPTLSTGIAETAMVIAMRLNGELLRLYPVPFDRVSGRQPFGRFDWIECELLPNPYDARGRSYFPLDLVRRHSPNAGLTGEAYRSKWPVLTRLRQLRSSQQSVVFFKPAAVQDLCRELLCAQWDFGELSLRRGSSWQRDLFNEQWHRVRTVLEPMPCQYSYVLSDSAGQTATLPIMDWGLAEAYLQASGESAALDAVYQQFGQPYRSDLLLCLTRLQSTTPRWAIAAVLDARQLAGGAPSQRDAESGPSKLPERSDTQSS